jgi:hypothetical protein
VRVREREEGGRRARRSGKGEGDSRYIEVRGTARMILEPRRLGDPRGIKASFAYPREYAFLSTAPLTLWASRAPLAKGRRRWFFSSLGASNFQDYYRVSEGCGIIIVRIINGEKRPYSCLIASGMPLLTCSSGSLQGAFREPSGSLFIFHVLLMGPVAHPRPVC